MADIDKRLHYFNGQFLEDVDFQAEQDYFVERQRRHNRLLHTFGIAEGLTVAVVGGKTVTVSPGTAIDGLGRQIVLTQGDTRSLPLSPAGKTVLVVLSYAEATADGATVGGSGDTRVQERPTVQLVVDDTNAPAADTFLRLARLTVAGDGTLSGSVDSTPRVLAGSRLGSDTSVQTLRLSNSGDPRTWPVLTSNAANESDLAGNLVVSGDLKAGPSAQSVVAHLTDRTNPHGTTAAQVGALASVAGVTSTTGNVGLTQGGAIVISPDATNKRVIISESHSMLTGNPHGTLASQLPDFDLGGRSLNLLSWVGTGAAPASLTLTFVPRIVWVSGQCSATLNSGVQVGGIITGFADLRDTNAPSGGGGPATSLVTSAATIGKTALTTTATLATTAGTVIPPPPPPNYPQNAFGPQINRTAAGVLVNSSSVSSGVIAVAGFNDSNAPVQDVTATLKITNVSGFTLTFAASMTNASGSTQLKNFTMNLALFCMGVGSSSSSSGGGGGAPLPGGSNI